MSVVASIRFYLLAIMLALCLWFPSQAYAGDPLAHNACLTGFVPPSLVTSTGNVITPTPFTSEVVYCMQTTFEQAVNALLSGISAYMWPIVVAAFTLALVVFGMRVLLEHDTQHTNKMFGMPVSADFAWETKGTAFLLRLGIVGVFSYGLGSNSIIYCNGNGQCGMPQAIYDIEQQMITLVSGSFSPWAQMDYFLGLLIDPNFSATALSAGLLGLIGGMLFSSTIGIGAFVSAIMALVELVLFMFDIVFTYLTAMLTIGFMIIISPFVIPTAIFFHTEKYFTKWLHILIAAMLAPVLIFACLTLFLGIFNILISNILMILGSTCVSVSDLSTCTALDLHTFWRNNVPMFAWLMPMDPSFNAAQMANNPGAPVMPPVQGFLNPNLGLGANINPLAFPGVSFGGGANDWNILTQLILSFIALWMFSSVMKSIVNKMPEVAEDIAGAISGVRVQPSPVRKPVRQFVNNLAQAQKKA